ncbi:MAG: hypothetical protein V3U75_01105 [Methylococcaceae bacterium]
MMKTNRATVQRGGESRLRKPRVGGGIGVFINRLQTIFVGALRIWTIPIVLMLSVASGFTTYYGMSYFIIPWIALIITIAIQSIIVICSLEIAGIHWKANRFRYFTIIASLLISLAASISFSYFKFYEVSERETIQISRLNLVRKEINNYVNQLIAVKGQILDSKKITMDKASQEASKAYFGTHPQVTPKYKNRVGEGPFWRHYNRLYLTEKKHYESLENGFSQLDQKIQSLQQYVSSLGVHSGNSKKDYQAVADSFKAVQLSFSEQASSVGHAVPKPPILMPYAQFVQGVTPSFAMWDSFSLFAFICAAMVDFFTVLLSYRLEFTAPGPLTTEEKELVFQCLREFTEFRINENDELEMVIEKTEIERARRYSDWSRMFAVGLLLNRGFLRKIDQRTVEFAPNLYPLMSEKMGSKIRELKALKLASMNANDQENNVHEGAKASEWKNFSHG